MARDVGLQQAALRQHTTADRSFWKNAWPNSRPASLRLDFPRSAAPVSAAGQLSFEIASDICESLGRLTNDGPFLVYTVLHAVLALWFHRQNGTGRLRIGTPSLRVDEADTGIDNALPVFTSVDEGIDFREYLNQVRNHLLDVYRHQHYPATRLIEDLGLASEPGRSALFDVVVGLAELHVPLPETSADVFLLFVRRGRSLRAEVIWRTTLFKETTVTCFLRQFETLLRESTCNPSGKLSTFRLLSPAERSDILTMGSGALVAFPQGRSVASLFAGQAERAPAATAVVDGDNRWSYRELNSRANQIAHRLRAMGAGPNKVIGLCVERSLDMVAALLGILKAGAAYLPLDPSYPAERLAVMIAEFPPAVIVTENGKLDALELRHAGVLDLARHSEEIASESMENPEIAAADLAYVIYTSGSTGKPKCAGVNHRGWTNLLSWYALEFELGSNDRTLLATSLSFDLTQKDIVTPLITGGQLHLAPPRFDPWVVLRQIGREGITVLNCTPSMSYALVEDSGPDYAETLLPLRLLVLGGEPIAFPRLTPWTRTAGFRTEIANTYGPTECTDISCFYRIRDAQTWRETAIPIGRPVPNTQSWILGDDGELAPMGIVGELCIGGAGVGRGYLNDAELTAEKFVANPFSGDAASRLYRTGDLARLLPDGNIEFAGRVDEQIKVRGFRIETGEVEAAVANHPAVQSCAVTAIDGTSGDRRLAAFVVPSREAAPVVRRFVERENGSERTCELPNGMIFFHLNRNETDFVYREIYEQNRYLRNGIELPDDAVVFDVGANIGLFALSVARRYPRVRIFAFEPIPPVFDVLKRNVDLYEADVLCCDFGLSDGACLHTMTYYPHVSIMSGYYSGTEEEQENVRIFLRNRPDAATADEIDELVAERMAGETVECRFRTLSEVIAEHAVDSIDLLKIDVEKSELDVLHGIEERDWPRIGQIVMEVHDIEGRLEAIRSQLGSKGFHVVCEQDTDLRNSNIYNLYARHGGWRRTPASHAVQTGWASPRALISDLETFVRDRLPDYMVPNAIHLLAALPLTLSGKVDRQALPDAIRGDIGADRKFVAPSSELEQRLAALWAEALQADVAVIGIDDDFFRLGGHSLLATRVTSHIRRIFQIEVPIAVFFETPTVRAIGHYVENALLVSIESLSEDEAQAMAASATGSD